MDISYCDDKTGFPRPGHIYGMAIVDLKVAQLSGLFELQLKISLIISQIPI